MPAIKVTSEHVATVSQQLATGSTSITGELTRLRGLVENLVGSGWTGNASDSFHGLYSDWHTASGKLQTALEGISGALNTSAQNYADAESTNQKNFA